MTCCLEAVVTGCGASRSIHLRLHPHSSDWSEVEKLSLYVLCAHCRVLQFAISISNRALPSQTGRAVLHVAGAHEARVLGLYIIYIYAYMMCIYIYIYI